MLRKHKYSQEEMLNLKFLLLKLQNVMVSFPSKLFPVKHTFFFFTFGSVRNYDLRTEFVISYFLFYSTETGSAVIKYSGISTGFLNIRELSC